jgi:hypothetical protein
MKKLLLASSMALLVVGLSQRPASAICYEIHKPCIDIQLPPFPLVCPSFKLSCVKCACKNGYVAPNPWYTYYPPAAYGPYPQVYYPNYGAPPVHIIPQVQAPLPTPEQNAAKGIVPTSATQTTAAKTATKQQFGSAKDAFTGAFHNVTQTQQAPPAQPAQPTIYQLQPVIGGGYDYSAPSYWYGR